MKPTLSLVLFALVGAPFAMGQVGSTMTAATCSGGVTGILSSSGSVDIYDGSAIVASNIASSGLINAFSWATPSNWQSDGKFHVISAALHGTNSELIGSPQSFSCNATATQYTYEYDKVFSTTSGLDSNWTPNKASGTTGWINSSGVLTSSDAASAIYIPSVTAQNSSQLSDSTQYEINTTISMPGGNLTIGTFFHYIWANSTALATSSGSQGTFHAIGITPTFDGDGNCAASLSAYDVVNGSATLLGTSTVPCATTMQMRTVVFKLPASNVTKVWTFIDGELYSAGTTLSPGQPGFGAVGVNSAAWGYSEVKVGARSIIGPPSIGPVNNSSNPTTVSTSAFPTVVDFQWQQPVDSSGIGVIQHWFDRMTTTAVDEATGTGFLGAAWTDSVGVSASQNYNYMELERGFHGLYSGVTNIWVLTPPPNNVDPRRIGVRPTGSYWGGMGEQLDNLSGNLNFSIPLLTAKGRSGASFPLSLAYNSQNWREDTGTGPGTAIWNLGEDIGYGYGWKVQFGSLTPYWNSGYYGVDHYLLVDGSGAEYLLNVNNGGVWTSSESNYVYYNAGQNVLYFKDGTQWYMNATSGGFEPDYGTMYPTEIRDTNGNQIIVTYQTGYGTLWPNSSGRISAIEDPRAVSGNSNCTRCTYYFSYLKETGDPIPMHLSAVGNTIGTNEAYTTALNNSSTATAALTLKDPFASNGYGSLYDLTGITMPNASLSYAFNYDGNGSTAASGAAQLTQVTFPFGGTLGWSYASTQYNGLSPRYQEEVTGRTMNPGSGSSSYNFTRTFGSGPTPVHNQTTLTDPHGDSEVWTFNTTQTAGPSSVGLAASIQRNSTGGGTPSSTSLTWSADGASNAYVSASQSCRYASCSNTQTAVDNFGNPTTIKDWDYGVSTGNTPTRTYAYTYLHSTGTYASNYAANYVLNRALTKKVTDSNNNTFTLFTNTYDGSNNGSAPAAGGAPYEWNPAYSTAGTPATKYRGNLTQSASKGVTNTYTVTAAGYTTAASNSITTVNASYSNSTNYNAPDSVNANGNSSLQTNLGYSAFLAPTSVTDNGNGGSWTYAYDAAGRPKTATGPLRGTSNTSAVKTYAYSTSSPFTTTVKITASDNAQNRYTKTTFDGFGRTVSVSTYDSASNQQSEVDTVYAPWASAPLGVKTQVSEPYLPPASPVYTTTAYDGAGNVVSNTLADSSKTSYSFSGNSVTATDPAGNWKTVTKDMFGNTVQVVEPDPASQPGGTYTTAYSYNALNSILTVNLGTRDGKTQPNRIFTYDPTTYRLTSKTEPETGPTTYTYNADGTVASKKIGTNAVYYGYDAYGRMTSDGIGTIAYDSDGGYSPAIYTGQNLSGRVAYKSTPCTQFASNAICLEFFSYSQAGDVVAENFFVDIGGADPSLTAAFSYDNEGRLTGLTYPDGSAYTYSFDTMGRPVSMTGPGSTSIASGATYSPAGLLTQITQGGLVETRAYNSLNQLTGIRKGSSIYTQYNYISGANNGQIASMQDRLNGNAVTYSYDPLKRLSATSTTSYPTIPNASFESSSGGAPTSWGCCAVVSTTKVHSGAYSLFLAPGANSSNITLTGLAPSTSYNVGVYYYIPASGTTLTLTVAGTPITATTVGSWQFLWGSFTSNSLGAMTVAVSVNSNGTAYLDDVTISGGPASPTVTQAEQYGYDGFGNLVSQTPTVGSGVTMSLSVDVTTNRVTGQGTYDGAGNFQGNSQYSFDILNRLSGAGSYSYLYTPGDNKRMAVYSPNGSYNGQTAPVATFNFYDPQGRKLGYYVYQSKVASAWGPYFAVSPAKNILYLGSKRVDESEDRVGSNWDQAQYTPWGQWQSGQQPTETQGFGTYVADSGSGLYYADQRYYMPTWGRFLTPDPSDANIDYGNPTSWNRFAYVNGDPANQSDPSGQDGNYSQIDNGGCPPDADTCGGPYESGAVFTASGTSSASSSSSDDGNYGFDSSGQGGIDWGDPTYGQASGGGGGGTATIAANLTSPSQNQNQQRRCAALAQKIANLQQTLLNKAYDLETDPESLPDDLPGAPDKASRWGHVSLYLRYQEALDKAVATYQSECGGGPPPVVAPKAVPTAPSDYKTPKWLLYGTVTIGVGACLAFFEVCVPAAGVIFAF